MTKEADPVPPKKRKQETTDVTNGSAEAKTSKLDVDEKKPVALSIYQRVAAFEESEALTRDPTVDLEQYRVLCKEFADHVCHVSDLMTSKPEGWADELKKRQMEAGLLTVFMKKLNRIEKIRNRNARENVTKVRQQVDVSQLQLQNLLCEIQHLNREVEKCLLFKSKPLGVDLVPVDEFYKEAPEKITRPETTRSDEHQLLLARLEWELVQRKELSVLCSKLEEKKKSLSSQISNRTSDLESLAPLIKNVLVSTKPLQEKLGFVPGPSSSTPEKASFLPHCLYFLYIQAKAYKEAIDDKLTIEIKNDEDAAKEAMKQNLGEKESKVSSGDESDNDTQDPEKPAKKDNPEKLERKRKKLFEKHPLYVSMKLVFKDNSCLTLDFYYWLNLNIITVVPNLELTNNQLKSSEAGEQLYGKNVLVNLFPGDSGTVSPNVSNYYQLEEVGLEALDTKKLGFPYVWAQKIGGLDFTSVGPDSKSGGVEPQLETAKTIVPIVVKILRRRINSRIILSKQIIALESKIIMGPPAMKSVKLSCSLKSWKSITWNDFREHPASEQLRDTDFATPQDLYFNATVTRGKAKLTILVIAKCDYPVDPPKFAIQIDWNDSVLNASNSAKIREIEREVNVHWKELSEDEAWASTLLIYQIHRIMVCFDIFLECSDPVKFSAEKKTFLHPHSGRCRSHPLKYVAMGEGVFLRR